MLENKIYLSSPALISGSDYDVDIYFINPSKARYLNIGDRITDSVGNTYSIYDISSPFSDGGVVSVTAITNNVPPIADAGYDSVAFTPEQESFQPDIQTAGYIHTASLIDPTAYEYEIYATWISSAEANKAIIGTKVLDSEGKEFEISFLDAVDRFAVIFKAKEVHRIGDQPILGRATMYTSTENYGFYQGEEVEGEAYSQIMARDAAVLDSKLREIELGIGGGGDKHYPFSQNIPSAVWLINHGLNKFPAATVIDSGGNEVVGDINYVNNNNMTITFSSAFAGKCYLN